MDEKSGGYAGIGSRQRFMEKNYHALGIQDVEHMR